MSAASTAKAAAKLLVEQAATPVATVVGKSIWVSRTFPQKPPVDPATGVEVPGFVEEPLGVKKFESTPALVSAAMGATINLGNFESLRIDVGVTLPCYPEEVKEGIEAALQLVSGRLSEERDAVNAVLKGNSTF